MSSETFHAPIGSMVVAPAILTASSILFVIVRVYVRSVITKSIWWDDAALVISQVILVGIAACLFSMAKVNESQGPIVAFEKLIDYEISLECLYLADQIVLKWAVALFFLRIIQKPWQRWTIHVATTLYSLFALAVIMLAIFQCGTPNGKDWLFGKCIDVKTVLEPINFLVAVLNVVMDWGMVAVAIIAMQDVQLTPRKKLSVISLILLGCAGSIMSIVRLAYIKYWHIAHTVQEFLDALPLILTSLAELMLTAMCLSTVAYRPLISHLRDGPNTGFRLTTRTRMSRPSVSKSALRLGSMESMQPISSSQTGGLSAKDREILVISEFDIQSYPPGALPDTHFDFGARAHELPAATGPRMDV